MLRHSASAALALGLACGPATGDPDDDDASTSTNASTDGDDDDTTFASPTETTADDDRVDASSDSAASGSSGADGSTTGEPWTFGADQAHTELTCGRAGPRVWIEIYRDEDDGACLPSPDVDLASLVLVSVEPWDGLAGTFEVGSDDGAAQASIGVSEGAAIGTIAIHVAAPWAVASAEIELSTETDSVAGTVDLAGCFTTEPVDPCE